MFEAVKNFLADLADGDRPAGGLNDDEVRLATGALLVHAASVDGEVSAAERDKLRDLLKQRFDLDDKAASELIERAFVADEKAVDLYHFTHLLNTSLDDKERCRIVEMMWAVAYADGVASDFENNLIWRVADLIGVPSTERIALRRRAAGEAGA